MKHLTSADVRRMFIEYFARNQHKVVASHSLIPPDDPTLLFVNAGMVQFKDVFVGRKDIGATRATSSQKCLRVSGKHNDLENVGRTARHHTFFEMLGNFSFGDYFKRESIRFAWEFLTSPEYIGLPVEPLWVTVHPDDQEAYDIWHHEIGVSASRIVRDPDNFWSMGDTGPCGPCSEIHIDQGAALSGGEEVPFGQGGDRYLELWNLVFMQFDRSAHGVLTPLPKPSIDTGMGLERICAVVAGKTSNYDSDLFLRLIGRMEEISGARYEGRYAPDARLDPAVESDVAFRVIADHARSAAFLIADGIYPENEGRGYVLRRVMRRAIRFGRKLGVEGEFLVDICQEVVSQMGEVYPELLAAREVIAKVVRQEEARFGRTLQDGLRLLDGALANVRAEGGSLLPGNVVFALYDTHGFPVDLTRLIAEEQGLGVDETGFQAAMEAQRERGRASWKGGAQEGDATYAQLSDSGVSTEFVGYEWAEASASVLALLQDGKRTERVHAGEAAELFASRTPMYAEGGGQVGDLGTFEGPGGLRGRVVDTQRRAFGLHAHVVQVEAGTLELGQEITLSVDGERRAPTMRNHSATHLLHWALRTVLGEHVKQRGSLVAPDRLRFDFSHFGPVTDAELSRIEWLVNERVVRNAPVQVAEMSMDEAAAKGAIAFFGEKYGERVRVVAMAESIELCGGTHVASTGDIGLLKLIGETGISSGVRRIEAVTGLAAVHWTQDQDRRWRELAARLKTAPVDLERRVDKLVRESEQLQAEVRALKTQLARARGGDVDDQIREFGGVRAIAQLLDGVEAKDLRETSDQLLNKLGTGVVFLGNREGDRATILVAVSSPLAGRVHAGQLVQALAPIVGGRGGGKPTMAQAGGRDVARLPEAVEHFWSALGQALGE